MGCGIEGGRGIRGTTTCPAFFLLGIVARLPSRFIRIQRSNKQSRDSRILVTSIAAGDGQRRKRQSALRTSTIATAHVQSMVFE